MKDNIKQALQVVLIVLGPLLLKHHLSVDGGLVDDIAGWLSLGYGIYWKFRHWNTTPDQPAPAPAPARGTVHLLFLIGLSAALVSGCTTSQQKIAVNSLFSVEKLTTGAVDTYDALVIQGKVPTNDVPKISKAYNDFHAAFLIAVDAAQYNTNAIAPPNLVLESQDIVNLITTIEGKAKQ